MDFEPSIVTSEWNQVLDFLETQFNKRPADVDSVLFLIGVQELGKGHATFSKEQKQDLMHIATCKVLSFSGFYTLEGLDAEGWPHWNLVQAVPQMPLKEQEILIKAHIIQYFKSEVFSPEQA
ncbi:hypothetical protein EWU23_05645 [Cytophagaceae bacterium 50C-KIRBA]|uniref:Uncharacterized protein n=1 Tax=Aquirufa beregesia TaxID=2516556 RepID=A0ABX0EV28_9BACT|nr:hypothetical protein [Aquirufa beregesia]NGZ43958.1 hypothetical protein [Aquirufa beregesia]